MPRGLLASRTLLSMAMLRSRWRSTSRWCSKRSSVRRAYPSARALCSCGPIFSCRADGVDFPVLLIIAYSNRPEDFDNQLPAFERLLDRVQLMSDRDVLASGSPALFACKPEVSKLSVMVRVDASGGVEWGGVQAPGESPPMPRPDGVTHIPTCVDRALDAMRFEPTGAARSITEVLESGAAERAPRGFLRTQKRGAANELSPEPAPIEL